MSCLSREELARDVAVAARRHAPTCPYCDGRAELIDSEEVYGPGRDFGKLWSCRRCDAYVGTHRDSATHAPLGRLADAELRYWKQRAHAAFDPLWKAKQRRDRCSKSRARKAAYEWLAKRLGVGRRRCHIGWMDVDDCKHVVAICREVRGDPDL